MIIVSDHNVRGAVRALRRVMERDWADFVLGYEIEFKQLEELGLNAKSTDEEIYVRCLEADAFLVTGDKTTNDGEDSLESVIRRLGRADSAPVITIGNQAMVLKDPDYLGQCAMDLIDCLTDIENRRGTGRVFIPYQWQGARR